MAEIEKLEEIVDTITGASLMRTTENFILVSSEEIMKEARAALDAAGLVDINIYVEKTTIWHDGNFHGENVKYRVVESENGDEYILVTSRDGEDGLYDADPVNFIMGRVEDWVNCTYHPCRVRDALRELDAEASKVDDKYDDDEREYVLADEDFWLVIDDEEQPTKFTALVFEADCEKVAWRNCSEGTDDHDVIYLVNAGPHAGQYLRDYASRWEGSSDYEATLHDAADLPSWARVQLGLEDDED